MNTKISLAQDTAKVIIQHMMDNYWIEFVDTEEYEEVVEYVSDSVYSALTVVEVNPLWKNQVDSRVVSLEKFKELFNACVEDTP